MELCMTALLAAAFAFRNSISLLCVAAVAVGMAAPPGACHLLWRYVVRPKTRATCTQGPDHS